MAKQAKNAALPSPKNIASSVISPIICVPYREGFSCSFGDVSLLAQHRRHAAAEEPGKVTETQFWFESR